MLLKAALIKWTGKVCTCAQSRVKPAGLSLPGLQPDVLDAFTIDEQKRCSLNTAGVL